MLSLPVYAPEGSSGSALAQSRAALAAASKEVRDLSLARNVPRLPAGLLPSLPVLTPLAPQARRETSQRRRVPGADGGASTPQRAPRALAGSATAGGAGGADGDAQSAPETRGAARGALRAFGRSSISIRAMKVQKKLATGLARMVGKGGAGENEDAIAELPSIPKKKRTARRKMSVREEVTCRDVFNLFDYDGSGTVSIEELRAIIRNLLGEELDDASLRSMIQDVDVDGDGEISYDEFKQQMEQVLATPNQDLMKSAAAAGGGGEDHASSDTGRPDGAEAAAADGEDGLGSLDLKRRSQRASLKKKRVSDVSAGPGRRMSRSMVGSGMSAEPDDSDDSSSDDEEEAANRAKMSQWWRLGGVIKTAAGRMDLAYYGAGGVSFLPSSLGGKQSEKKRKEAKALAQHNAMVAHFNLRRLPVTESGPPGASDGRLKAFRAALDNKTRFQLWRIAVYDQLRRPFNPDNTYKKIWDMMIMGIVCFQVIYVPYVKRTLLPLLLLVLVLVLVLALVLRPRSPAGAALLLLLLRPPRRHHHHHHHHYYSS